MCPLLAMVMLGANWCWCTDTDKEAHLATCLEMPLSMPRSVVIDHTHQILKYVACMFVGGSPPVGLVILGTDWCWYADTNKEAQLGFH